MAVVDSQRESGRTEASMKRNRLFLNIGRKLYALSRVGIQPVVWRLMKLRRGGEIEAIYDVHNADGDWSCDCGSMMRPETSKFLSSTAP